MTNMEQNLTTSRKSVDGVLGIQTQHHRTASADESTDLLHPPISSHSLKAIQIHQKLKASLGYELGSSSRRQAG